MEVDVYTGMAIDAFRKELNAQRRYWKAQSEAQQAARLVPKGQRTLYFLYTEVVRFEVDRRIADEENDQDTVRACDELIVQTRAKIVEIEQAPQPESKEDKNVS